MDADGSARLLTGWGRTAPSRACVLAPGTDGEAASVLATPHERGVLGRGFGRSYGDAAQNAGGQVLLTSGLADVRWFDTLAGRISVGAGTSMADLIRTALPHGWFPAVTPGTAAVSVGGAVASDVHGKNHHRNGSFCEHVTGLKLARPGGEVVSLTPDSDAFWATAGGMGLTGLILSVDLALHRVETPFMWTRAQRARDLDEAMELLAAADGDWHYTVAWIDLLATGRRLGRGEISAGEHARVQDLPAARHRFPLERPCERWAPRIPSWPGRGALSPAGVRAFNAFYHRRAPTAAREGLQTIERFFYPLDRVREWNRLYGRAGFLQYQLVVPLGQEPALRRMVEQLARARVPSYLSVLKRLGPGRGPLAFPMHGWTLTLDIPAAAPGVQAALDRLDEAVADCGGRVYLAKDARLRPDLLAVMYPQLARWRAARSRLDPTAQMRSDLARRLGLVDGRS